MHALAGRMFARLRAAMALLRFHEDEITSADDEAAFSRHAIELTADYIVLASAFMLVAIPAWWPVDQLVKPDARYLEGFARLRASGLVIVAVSLFLFLASDRARRASLALAPILHGALLGAIGYWLGWIGGAELSWLADAHIGILLMALAPLRFGRRVASTLFVGLALPASFLIPFPENLRAPAMKGQLSFVVFTILGTIAIGEVLYRVLRRSFFQQRALDRARRGLAELNASLADRVAAQTRDLRALAGHLERVQEAERRRISRDLHDALAQDLTAMRYTLALLGERRAEHPSSTGDLIDDLGALLDGTTATVRGFISELRPRVLDDLGLVAAAEWLCERLQTSGEIACKLIVAEDFPDERDAIDPETALTLFRVLQEATTNARRHGRPSVLEVALRVDGDGLTASVKDDGAGFDPSIPSSGFGLLGLRERVSGAGGQLVVESAPGRGTRVVATVSSRIHRPSPPTVHEREAAG